TGPHVDITLFVIGEGRWATSNFRNATVPLDDLSWDFLTSSSNYASLRQNALTANGGRTWLTTFARAGALLKPGQVGAMFVTGDDVSGPASTIADAYIAEALKNGETGGACQTSFDGNVEDASLVVDTCPPDSTDPTACPPPPAGQLDARIFACG